MAFEEFDMNRVSIGVVGLIQMLWNFIRRLVLSRKAYRNKGIITMVSTVTSL